MHCAPLLVSAHVDGALRLAEAARIAAHVEGCPRCARQARDERALRRALKALPAPPLPERLKLFLAL
jgi:anti-sigma factor RsiW